jgi:ribose transport system ATP-binding protein
LAGFLVVVASFFINDEKSPLAIAAGFALIFVGAFVAGAVNGVLIRFANFTVIAATLATYIGLQGMRFLLRDGPGGYINGTVVSALNWQWAADSRRFHGGEYLLRKSRRGWQLRAAGSDEGAARRIGVRADRIFVAGDVGSSLMTAFGAIMLMAQIGVGDPRQGASYTLSSITAVVLGGASLRGGRGTFAGTVLGALLLTEVLNAASLLNLSETYQHVFQGALVLVAALFYPTVRCRAAA